MLATLARRSTQKAAAEQAAKSQLSYIQQIRQRYPPKKVWPPDLKKLSPGEQLKFEKKYKRRMALAMVNPGWVKFTKLIQLFGIVSVVIYCVFFMEGKDGNIPFEGARRIVWEDVFGSEYNPTRKSTQDTQPPVLQQGK